MAAPVRIMTGDGIPVKAATPLPVADVASNESLESIAASTDAPASPTVDEDTTSRGLIALLKGSKNLLIDIVGHLATLAGCVSAGSLSIHLGEVLSSALDSIDVAKMSKGAVSTAATLGLSAVDATTTSTEIDARGHNYIAVMLTVAADFDWTFKLIGSMTSGGTFADVYDGAAPCVSAVLANGSRIIMWPCGVPYAKIVATEGESGTTATVSAVLFNR